MMLIRQQIRDILICKTIIFLFSRLVIIKQKSHILYLIYPNTSVLYDLIDIYNQSVKKKRISHRENKFVCLIIRTNS